MRKKLTVEDLKATAALLARMPQPPRTLSPLLFTRPEVDRFIAEGEMVDIEKMTINNYPFQFYDWNDLIL